MSTGAQQSCSANHESDAFAFAVLFDLRPCLRRPRHINELSFNLPTPHYDVAFWCTVFLLASAPRVASFFTLLVGSSPRRPSRSGIISSRAPSLTSRAFARVDTSPSVSRF